jgi:hypothetical protein
MRGRELYFYLGMSKKCVRRKTGLAPTRTTVAAIGIAGMREMRRGTEVFCVLTRGSQNAKHQEVCAHERAVTVP